MGEVALTVSLALFRLHHAGTAQTASPTQSPTTSPPTSKPTQSPTPRERLTESPIEPFWPEDITKLAFGVEEYVRIRDLIIAASPSSLDAMSDEGSPQYRAFYWLYAGNGRDGSLRYSERRIVQRWILASFYYATAGEGWIGSEGWVRSRPAEDRGSIGVIDNECDWYGVSCLDGMVSKLELEQNKLVGEIVPEIALWAGNLYVLSIGNYHEAPENERNKIATPLPAFLGDLTNLRVLNLEGVGLTSSIPRTLFSSWSSMEMLTMSNNDLTGTLPESIKDLKSIEVLWLGGNNLGGSLVSELGQLVTLKHLSLESNYREDAAGKRGFVMNIPTSFGALTNLESLSLADNALSGLVPMQMGGMESLRRLQLSGNFFEGQLPPSLGRLDLLQELDISFNW